MRDPKFDGLEEICSRSSQNDLVIMAGIVVRHMGSEAKAVLLGRAVTEQDLAAFVGRLDSRTAALVEKAASARYLAAAKEEDDAFDKAHPFPEDGSPSFAKGLTYSATSRCPCGAGLVYANHHRKDERYFCCEKVYLATPEEHAKFKRVDSSPMGPQKCVGEDGQEHAIYPWWCYEIKSEWQPSANGMTTRPGPWKIDADTQALMCKHVVDPETGRWCGTSFARETDHRVLMEHAKTHQEKEEQQ